MTGRVFAIGFWNFRKMAENAIQAWREEERMTFEHLNQNNVEEYIAYLKAVMKEEPEKMTAERVDEQKRTGFMKILRG